MESDATSHPRSSLLTSFLGRSTRPRSTVNNNLSPGYPSPTTETAPAVSGTVPMNIGNIAVGNRRRGASGAGGAQGLGPSSLPSGSQMPNPASITANTITQMLRRRRSANGPSLVVSNPPNPGHGPPANHMNAANAPATPAVAPVLGSAHRIRLVPHLESQRSLHFDPITRECREGAQPIRIGRFTDRTGSLAASTNSLTGKIAFKSKVVSRGHAELWCEPNAKVGVHVDFIGNFMRLSFGVDRHHTVFHQRHVLFVGHLSQPHETVPCGYGISSVSPQGRRYSPTRRGLSRRDRRNIPMRQNSRRNRSRMAGGSQCIQVDEVSPLVFLELTLEQYRRISATSLAIQSPQCGSYIHRAYTIHYHGLKAKDGRRRLLYL